MYYWKHKNVFIKLLFYSTHPRQPTPRFIIFLYTKHNVSSFPAHYADGRPVKILRSSEVFRYSDNCDKCMINWTTVLKNSIVSKVVDFIGSKYTFDFIQCSEHKTVIKLNHFISLVLSVTKMNWCKMIIL